MDTTCDGMLCVLLRIMLGAACLPVRAHSDACSSGGVQNHMVLSRMVLSHVQARHGMA